MLQNSNDSYNKELKNQLEEEMINPELNSYLCYFCENCWNSIIINKLFYHITLKRIYLECECLCKRIHNLSINGFYDRFKQKEINKSNGIIRINDLKCFEHKENIFAFNCVDCEKSLCLNCIREIHRNHSVISLNNKNIENIIDDLINSMYMKNNDKRDINNNTEMNNNTIINNKIFTIRDIDMTSKHSLEELLQKLKALYSSFPCYNIDLSIKNISKCCSDMQNFIIKNDNGNLKALDIIEERKIRFTWEFESIQDKEKIISILLIEQGITKINRLKNYDLNNLEKLSLKNNNLRDITPLKNIKFPNLKELLLEENKIEDENYEVFEKLDAKKLVFINLFKNNFNSPRIFQTLENFKELETFYIGNNKINFPFDEIYYDCSQIQEMGLSIGIFSDKTIKNIYKFIFNKLIKLYLSGNNISLLSFMKDLKCENLEEIWLMNNDIESLKELENLEKFKNLKIINLKNNKIKDISKLEGLKSRFQKLEKIILSGNKINKDSNIKILNQIREQQINIELY